LASIIIRYRTDGKVLIFMEQAWSHKTKININFNAKSQAEKNRINRTDREMVLDQAANKTPFMTPQKTGSRKKTSLWKYEIPPMVTPTRWRA
jgi:hypothetical protein